MQDAYADYSDPVQGFLNDFQRRLAEGHPLKLYKSEKYLFDKVKHKVRRVAIQDSVIRYGLENYHKNFWASALEVRVVYLEKVAFPLKSTDEQQQANVSKLIQRAFPWKQGDGKSDNWYAQSIANVYFGEAELPEQRLLATALLAANMREAGAPELRVGERLYNVLSHMGPAGGALLQAIHSHPQTPEHIRQDLSKSKIMYDPPKRWEAVQLLKDAGLLSASHPNRIKHIGKVEGSGKFGITMFNTLADGSEVADTFLRPHAANRAEREFGMMQNAATNLSESIPELKPTVGMVTEARRSAKVEADMSFAKQANELAEKSYHGIKVTVEQDGKTYEFTHHVTKFIEHGDNYKRVEIAHGKHFNIKDLPETSAEEISYKKAIAKTMIATQLSLRLSGINTDLDRHGGNIKIHEGKIYHFDFGAMNITPLTSEDKKVTGKIMAQVIKDVKDKKDFSQALMARIEKAEVSPETRVYLDGLQKDFLALGDYTNTLNPDELSAVFARCLTAKTLDKEIRSSFNKEIGMLSTFVNSALGTKSASAGVTIERMELGVYDGAAPDSSSVKGAPKVTRGRKSGREGVE